MSETELPSIDPELATWCRGTSIGDDRDRLERRWAGICSLAELATPADIEAMVRIVFRTKAGATTQHANQLREPFKRADDLFETSGNDRELELLCAATLSHLARSKGVSAPIAAMIVTTTACSGLRKVELPIDLTGRCEQALAELAMENRKRPDWNGIAAAFSSAVEATPAAPISATESVAAFSAMVKLFTVQDEELQMLWWLVGERSSNFDCSFGSVPANSQALVFAHELAEITAISPGPVSIKGLLQRAGVKTSKKLGIVDSVNASDSRWLERLVEGMDPSPASAPIHFAIKRKVETNDQTSWVAGWAGATAMKSDAAMTGLGLGNQFYRECLLAKPRD